MHPHILSRNALTVYAAGVAHTIHSDDSRWSRAVELLKADDSDALVELMQPAKQVVAALNAGLGAASGITFQDGQLYFDGELLDASTDYTVNQILQFHREGLPVQALVNFYNRLRANPSFRVRRDLLRFLEKGQLPLTEDGFFMAYKRVNANFTDCATGKLDYTPGTVASMPREEVDDDPNHTCSAGLHVCSFEYLASFHGAKTISVKVDPADVVSIPTDYNDSKMRVCRFESVAEIEPPKEKNVWGSSVVGYNGPQLDYSNDYADREHEDDEDDDPYAEDDDPVDLKFSVGDKVTVRKAWDTDIEAVITEVDADDPTCTYHIALLDGSGGTLWVYESDLQPAP